MPNPLCPFNAPFRWSGVTALLLALLASGAHAKPADPDAEGAPLHPQSNLERHVVKARKHAPRAADAGCPIASRKGLEKTLPFGPGERLAYDIAVLGVPMGEISVQVDPIVTRGSARVMPVRASGETSMFFAMFGGLNAKMVSHIDVETQRPLRMVNRVHVKKAFQDEMMIREDATFSDDQVYGHVRYVRGDLEKDWDARRRSPSELLDVLSLVYYGRSRDLSTSGPFCFEIFHRRVLWRVQGNVGSVEKTDVPYGEQLARRIDATVTKVRRKKKPRKARATPGKPVRVKAAAKKQPTPRPVTLYVGEGEHRLPLLLVTENETLGEVHLRLTDFTAGQALTLVAGQTPSAPIVPVAHPR